MAGGFWKPSKGKQPQRGTYAPLLDSAEKNDFDKQTAPESRRFVAWALTLGLLVLATVGYSLATAGGLAPASHAGAAAYDYTDHDPRTHRCGASAHEAQRLGCSFDPTTLAWLPADCLDGELAAEFFAAEAGAGEGGGGVGNVTLYGDKDKSRTVGTAEQWAAHAGEDGGEAAWLTRGGRDVLCGWRWKRMHRAIVAGRNLPAGMGDYGETEMCVRHIWTAGTEQLDEVVESVLVAFPAC